MFLDEMNVNIDKPTTIKMININGEKKAPLGKINHVPIKINNDQWKIEIIVIESKNYNVILGSDWLSLTKGIMNYQEGTFYYEGTEDKDLTLMTCWQWFPNPHKLIEIEPIAQTKDDLELELEDEEDDTEPERILSVR